MKPKSTTLFHFTKSREVLQNILLRGFWPRYCLEDVSWVIETSGYAASDRFMAYPMVCFCDIPLSRIGEHVLFYGDYGIGLTRDWALRNGLAPVIYLTASNAISNAMMQFNELTRDAESETKSQLNRYIDTLMRHMKPLEGTMVVRGENLRKEFYQESEWRFVPDASAIANVVDPLDHPTPTELQKAIQSANEATMEHCMLRFVPSDVRYIFLKSDSDIPPMMNFIQSELDSFPGADLKILMSRVTSLESLSKDW